MSPISSSAVILACLFGAALIGILLRYILPEHHLSSDTKDTVKISMGLVATMAALVLGLLIAAATDKYDNESAGVTQMAAKVIFLDRMLANYGPEAKDVRELLKKMVGRIASPMWPDKATEEAQLDPSASRAEIVYAEIQKLAPQNDLQTMFKSQAVSTAFELGQLRWQEFEQGSASMSRPLLGILVFWLAILFLSFGMFAPSNSTVIVAPFMAALAVSVQSF